MEKESIIDKTNSNIFDENNSSSSNDNSIERKSNSIKSNLFDLDNNNIKVIKINKDNLRTSIIEWLSLDEDIKHHRKIIKDLSDEKKQYENKILELMNNLNEETIKTDKCNIIKNKKQSKGILTQDIIKSTLTTLLKSEDIADEYTQILFEKRPIKEIVNLKRKDFIKNK